jgi:hypothetical protein
LTRKKNRKFSWMAFSNSVVIFFSIASIRRRHSSNLRRLAYGIT